MKTAKTVIMAMIVALAMIGMTGLAMAGSEMTYEMEFESTGDGSLSIQTVSEAGSDVQNARWTNSYASGYQNGHVDGWRRMDIERGTTIDGLSWRAASGSIWTQSTDESGSTITAYATYNDGFVIGCETSGVSLEQDTIIRNYGSNEFMCTDVDIEGMSYTRSGGPSVTGSVVATTSGHRVATTYVYVAVDDGSIDMDVQAHVSDRRGHETSRMNFDVDATAGTTWGMPGFGVIVFGVSPPNAYTYIPFVNSDVDVDGTLYARVHGHQ